MKNSAKFIFSASIFAIFSLSAGTLFAAAGTPECDPQIDEILEDEHATCILKRNPWRERFREEINYEISQKRAKEDSPNAKLSKNLEKVGKFDDLEKAEQKSRELEQKRIAEKREREGTFQGGGYSITVGATCSHRHYSVRSIGPFSKIPIEEQTKIVLSEEFSLEDAVEIVMKSRLEALEKWGGFVDLKCFETETWAKRSLVSLLPYPELQAQVIASIVKKVVLEETFAQIEQDYLEIEDEKITDENAREHYTKILRYRQQKAYQAFFA